MIKEQKARQPTNKEKMSMLKTSEEKHLFINNQNKNTMNLSKEETKQVQAEAKKVSKFFKLEVTLSIFDHVLLHWVWPPQND